MQIVIDLDHTLAKPSYSLPPCCDPDIAKQVMTDDALLSCVPNSVLLSRIKKRPLHEVCVLSARGHWAFSASRAWLDGLGLEAVRLYVRCEHEAYLPAVQFKLARLSQMCPSTVYDDDEQLIAALANTQHEGVLWKR